MPFSNDHLRRVSGEEESNSRCKLIPMPAGGAVVEEVRAWGHHLDPSEPGADRQDLGVDAEDGVLGHVEEQDGDPLPR